MRTISKKILTASVSLGFLFAVAGASAQGGAPVKCFGSGEAGAGGNVPFLTFDSPDFAAGSELTVTINDGPDTNLGFLYGSFCRTVIDAYRLKVYAKRGGGCLFHKQRTFLEGQSGSASDSVLMIIPPAEPGSHLYFQWLGRSRTGDTIAASTQGCAVTVQAGGQQALTQSELRPRVKRSSRKEDVNELRRDLGM